MDRVLVAVDRDQPGIAKKWAAESGPFPGLITYRGEAVNRYVVAW